MDRAQLWEEHHKLIRFVARRYRFACQRDNAVDLEDLLQAGAIGLMEAADSWDEEQGAFSTWAVIHIRKRMREALGLNSRDPNRHQGLVPLDQPVFEDNEAASLLDTIQDDSIPASDERLIAQDTASIVQDAIANIPDEPSRRVVELIGLQGLSVPQAASQLDMETAHARRLYGAALCRLGADSTIQALHDDSAIYFRHKGLTRFLSDFSSTVEDVVLRLERLQKSTAKEA